MLLQLKGVFVSFEKNEVRYLVMGGIAAILHGVPRLTLDLDILIEASVPNIERLLKALLEVGFGTAAMIAPAELLKNEITVFDDIERLDVQTHTPGIQFADAWMRHERMDIDGVTVHVLCRADLIASKRAAGRPVDLEDVRLLELPDV